jgi:hypothetical protein
MRATNDFNNKARTFQKSGLRQEKATILTNVANLYTIGIFNLRSVFALPTRAFRLFQDRV